jgi:hypothetical protein
MYTAHKPSHDYQRLWIAAAHQRREAEGFQGIGKQYPGLATRARQPRAPIATAIPGAMCSYGRSIPHNPAMFGSAAMEGNASDPEHRSRAPGEHHGQQGGRHCGAQGMGHYGAVEADVSEDLGGGQRLAEYSDRDDEGSVLGCPGSCSLWAA